MILLGILLLVLGWLFGASILWTLGLVLIILGAAFWVYASIRGPVGGRRHLY